MYRTEPYTTLYFIRLCWFIITAIHIGPILGPSSGWSLNRWRVQLIMLSIYEISRYKHWLKYLNGGITMCFDTYYDIEQCTSFEWKHHDVFWYILWYWTVYVIWMEASRCVLIHIMILNSVRHLNGGITMCFDTYYGIKNVRQHNCFYYIR